MDKSKKKKRDKNAPFPGLMFMVYLEGFYYRQTFGHKAYSLIVNSTVVPPPFVLLQATRQKGVEPKTFWLHPVNLACLLYADFEIFVKCYFCPLFDISLKNCINDLFYQGLFDISLEGSCSIFRVKATFG